MSKGENVLGLAESALSENRDGVVSACKKIESGGDSDLSKGIALLLHQHRKVQCTPGSDIPTQIKGMVSQASPKLPIEDLVLSELISSELKTFISENENTEKLSRAGFRPAHTVLLSGLSGSGKSVLAGAIARKLSIPFLVVDYTRIISSNMGDTGRNIGNIFRSLADQRCLLFIDEMETVLTDRYHESTNGEYSRVVSTLLLEIERLPTNVILIGATNHKGMLDKAVIRHFEYLWDIPKHTKRYAEKWLSFYAARNPNLPIEENKKKLLDLYEGSSLSIFEVAVHRWSKNWIIKNT